MGQPKDELFVVEHNESSQEVSVYGFIPFVVGGETMGGEFLIRTNDGWDFRPIEEFAPYQPKALELVDADEDEG